MNRKAVSTRKCYRGKILYDIVDELYHVEFDISEKHEISAEYPEKIQELLQLTMAHREDMADALPDNLAGRIGE